METKTINCFPGYELVYDKESKKYRNMYRGTDVGFGGYVYSNPGMYSNVALLDISSMHPHSIIAMNCFGEYTSHFKDLLDARIAIKHGDYESARKMLNGRLAPYLDDESKAKELAQATKIAINSVYGLTSARFNNPFRDERNKNNIVALRGALTMRTLQDEVESRGYTIVAIRTDSIKIANATKEIVDFCMEFAKKYAYTFEFETVYDRMCQINDADYIARYQTAEECEKIYGTIPDDNKKNGGKWTATGAKFQVPYVFKTLFSKETIDFSDLCETKEVKTAIYLDKNEGLPDVSLYENLRGIRSRLRNIGIQDLTKKEIHSLEFYEHISDDELADEIAKGHEYSFIGKVGNFCPIKPGCGGGELVRMAKDTAGNVKYDAVTGTKGYRWLESEYVKSLEKEADIDRTYYQRLMDDAVETISQYGDFERFVADEPYIMEEEPYTFEEHPIDSGGPFDTNSVPWYDEDETFNRR